MVRDKPTPSGLAGVFLENRERLVRFFTSRLRDSADAEEVVQEIYVRLDTVNTGPIGDPVSYLHRIGLNLVIDRLRERERRARRERDWSDARTSYLGEEAVDESPSPFDELAHRERQERFERTLLSMPPGAARVFRMHRIEGLSHREVSERLGISRKGVEKHMSVALRHLAKEFTE